MCGIKLAGRFIKLDLTPLSVLLRTFPSFCLIRIPFQCAKLLRLSFQCIFNPSAFKARSLFKRINSRRWELIIELNAEACKELKNFYTLDFVRRVLKILVKGIYFMLICIYILNLQCLLFVPFWRGEWKLRFFMRSKILVSFT